VAQGKVQPDTSQKVQIWTELGFLRPNSEYARVNFFAHMLASLIPRDFLFQLTQAEKADGVANCDHLQNLTAPPELPSKEGWHLGCTAKRRRHPTQRRCHSDDAHEGQEKPEIPCGGAARLGHIAAAGEYEKEAVRVFYVAATRATQRLVVTCSVGEGLVRKLT
jgi:hypothetical protein